MKKKEIVPRGAQLPHNVDATPEGVAMDALMLRSREESLEVCAPMQELKQDVPEGYTLLAEHQGRLLMKHGRDIVLYATVSDDGALSVVNKVVATMDSDIKEAVTAERYVVILCEDGLRYLYLDGESEEYVLLNVDDAIGDIRLQSEDATEATVQVAGFNFTESYSTWGGALSQSDITRLSLALTTAQKSLTERITTLGAFTQPVIARWVVRMYDGNILYASAPVILGYGVQGADTLKMSVKVSSKAYTGVETSTMKMQQYVLGMRVVKRPSDVWLKLIASVDVLVAQVDTDLLTSQVTYNPYSIGADAYLTAHLIAVSDKDIYRRLANTLQWQRLASITQLPQEGVTLRLGNQLDTSASKVTSASLKTVTDSFCSRHVPSHIYSSAGSLYCIGGRRERRNPWQWFTQCRAQGIEGTATVKVTLSERTGEQTLSHQENTVSASTTLPRIVCVPHSNAIAMSLDAMVDGTSISRTLSLECNASGEYAFAVVE